MDFPFGKEAIKVSQKIDLKIRKSQLTNDFIEKDEERSISGY
jgi:hypothetical protein